MNLRAAVVDDLENDRLKIKNDIKEWAKTSGIKGTVCCDCFSGGDSFLNQDGRPEDYDLIFMDIRMDGRDGLEIVAKLREAGPTGLVIFVTTEKEYALDAYSLHPFDFLVKPYDRKRFDQLMNDAVRSLMPYAEEITVRIAYGEVKVPVTSIVSAVSNGHAVDYLLSDGKKFQARSSFNDTVETLGRYSCFISVNRGIVVNMDHILNIRKDMVVMTGGFSYPLRVRGRAELLREITQYQISNRMGKD